MGNYITDISAVPEELAERLRGIRHLLLDMDGTIYKGGTLFPFTVPFLERLKRLGIGYSFLTNNPSKSTSDYIGHLAKIGVPCGPDEIYTSTQATIDYLKSNYPEAKKLFILGTPSMAGEFKRHGYVSAEDSPHDEPDCLVVAFDMSLTYSRLCRAAWWAAQGKPYVATNPDRICPTDQLTVLVDCASICAAIETATGRRPDATMGKPQKEMIGGILESRGLAREEVAMVGDRIYTDIAMAHNTGIMGVLVLTGEAALEDTRSCARPPHIIVDNIGILGKILEISNNSDAYMY